MDSQAPLPYSIFAADIQRYSDRNHPLEHLELRGQLRDLLRAATIAVRIDRGEWELQDTGDGELALVPASVSKAWLVAEFVRELAMRLELLNRPRRTEEHLRLRVAMHHGDVIVDGTGYAGSAVITASRLLDSDPVRKALDVTPKADLAVILSDLMFQAVEGYRDLHQRHFQQADVNVKAFRGQAWVWVPGFPPPDLSAFDSSPGGSPPGEQPDSKGRKRDARPGDDSRAPTRSNADEHAGVSTVHGQASFGDRTYNLNDGMIGIGIFGDSQIGKVVRHDDEQDRD